MLHMPSPMLMQSGEKTYAEFQAHISSLTALTSAWTGNLVSTGPRRTTAAALTGAMAGSPWNHRATVSSVVARVIQHALPSLAVVNEQIAGGFEIYFQIVNLGNLIGFNEVTRNGYTSLQDYSVSQGGRSITDLIRWDDVAKKAWRSNPSIGGAETEYTW